MQVLILCKLHAYHNNYKFAVMLFSVAVVVWKQRRFFVDNSMLGVQLADVSIRCPVMKIWFIENSGPWDQDIQIIVNCLETTKS